jgi:hypothetical protein
MKRKKRRKKKWIQSALKHAKNGALHRQLGIPEGESIPLALLKKAEKLGGKLAKRAHLAETLKRISKKRKRHAHK